MKSIVYSLLLSLCAIQLVDQVKMPPKKIFLPLVDRIKVIEINFKSRNARKIAKDFEVGKPQVMHILKRNTEVLEEYENNSSWAKKRL